MSPSKAIPIFAQWIAAMGYNKKQVSKAGALLGMPTHQAGRRNRGEVEPDLVERLAMAAVRAGLPPWSPKTDAEIASFRHAVDFFRSVERQQRPPSKTKA